MINCEMGAEGTVVEGVKSIGSVKEVSGVFGNYDVILKIECTDVDEIKEILATKIRPLSKIRCTTTLVCAN